jgi:hypothetical protein
MRSLLSVAIGALVGGFIAGIVQLQLGIWFDAQEELIIAMMNQVLFVLTLALLLLAAMVVFGTERAVTAITILVVAVVVIGAVAVEVAALTLNAPTGVAEAWTRDGPILVELVLPMVVAALIQWWFARRHLRHAARARTI